MCARFNSKHTTTMHCAKKCGLFLLLVIIAVAIGAACNVLPEPAKIGSCRLGGRF